MAAISAIPDILNVAEGDYKARSFTAGEAITRCTVCCLNTSGQAVARPVAAGSGTPLPIIGVAQDDAAQYAPVNIIYSGIVNVANADDTTAIAIGSWVKVGTFKGAVVATTTATDTMIVGQVMETAIAGNSYGKIMLKLR